MDLPVSIRRLFGLTPLLIIVLLFGAPLLIWAVRDNPSPIETVKRPGRVLAIEDLPGPGDRVTVSLDDGTQLVVEPQNLPPDLAAGDKVVVIERQGENGKVTRSLEIPIR